MPYTDPLADLPTTWPSPLGKTVNADDTPSRELVTLLRQVREWMEKADAALREIEP